MFTYILLCTVPRIAHSNNTDAEAKALVVCQHVRHWCGFRRTPFTLSVQSLIFSLIQLSQVRNLTRCLYHLLHLQFQERHNSGERHLSL